MKIWKDSFWEGFTYLSTIEFGRKQIFQGFWVRFNFKYSIRTGFIRPLTILTSIRRF